MGKRVHPPVRTTSAARAQAGQSLPEFLVVVPVFLFLVLLVFQLVLVYRAKTTLDYATLEAARMGAVNGALTGPMREGLVRGLTPLYATDPGPAGIAAAWGKAALDLAWNAEITVISPTPEARQEYRERQYDGRYALPNDNLPFRPHTVGSSGVTVQDANLLKIKVVYHYPLIVPFVDRILRGDSDYVPSSGFFDSANVDMRKVPGLDRHFRIPLESFAIVRMQSPIYEDGGGPGGPGSK